jgi:aerobic-type carbon monoxide dehydrogenase small subunit (CoxS/CutS family)
LQERENWQAAIGILRSRLEPRYAGIPIFNCTSNRRILEDGFAGSPNPPRAARADMSQVTLTINGKTHTIDATPDLPLLWALRDKLNLIGSKYGCGIGNCGSCTVLVNGVPMRSCVMPAIATAGMDIVTIEGLDPTGNHPVQRAWNEVDVPQCGYCQSGQILTASALLARNPEPTDDDIDTAMSGVLCRCGTYSRIRKAVKLAAAYAAEAGGAS